MQETASPRTRTWFGSAGFHASHVLTVQISDPEQSQVRLFTWQSSTTHVPVLGVPEVYRQHKPGTDAMLQVQCVELKMH